MVKVKGKIISFTGKDATMVRTAAKKAKLSPQRYVTLAIENYARNVIFLDALDKWDEKKKIQGVQLKTERIKLRREGTD
jgi:hypothetical protein